VPAVLRVGSYNVRCANCASGDLPLELPWLQRRGAVAASIKAQKLDVVGVQEASQGWLKDADGNTVNKSQFEDLALQLGDPYKLTNSHRNNCVKSTTPTDCVYKDQGASQGTRILYNSDKLELISQGSKRLSEIKAADNDRYVAWAILEHKASGQRFFFASTHLENTGNTSGTNYSDLRIKQTQEILAVFKDKGDGLPGYVVGDFNSHKWTLPSNGPYDVMRGAGWVDPIGNTYRSTKTTSGATVQNRIRTNFSSFNGFKAVAPSFSYINGTYLDYIWTTPGVEVPEWETVVNVDADNNFVGIIPSDHNLIRATTVLP
jgi:endonuclease/exonuclease/phosphatase family metal-dependent hydrolase